MKQKLQIDYRFSVLPKRGTTVQFIVAHMHRGKRVQKYHAFFSLQSNKLENIV
jgi:hypothetical protein